MRFLLILPAVRPLPTAVYDTETCEWHNLSSVHRFSALVLGCAIFFCKFWYQFWWVGVSTRNHFVSWLLLQVWVVFFFHMVVSTIRIRLVLRFTKDLTKRDQETWQTFYIKQNRGHHQPPIFRQDIGTLAPWKSKAMFEALQVLDIERAIAASLSGVATEGEVLMKHVLASSKTNDKTEWWALSMNIHDAYHDDLWIELRIMRIDI